MPLSVAIWPFPAEKYRNLSFERKKSRGIAISIQENSALRLENALYIGYANSKASKFNQKQLHHYKNYHDRKQPQQNHDYTLEKSIAGKTHGALDIWRS